MDSGNNSILIRQSGKNLFRRGIVLLGNLSTCKKGKLLNTHSQMSRLPFSGREGSIEQM